jgi:hypothetical protein
VSHSHRNTDGPPWPNVFREIAVIGILTFPIMAKFLRVIASSDFEKTCNRQHH